MAKPFKGDSRAAISALKVFAEIMGPNQDLNPEPLDYNYGPTGRVNKPNPNEQLEYLGKLRDALKDVRGLPPAAHRAIFGNGKGDKSAE